MLKICKITCRVRDGANPPFFIGSMLRGAFGWALKATDGALFEAFFASQNAAHPYRFDFALNPARFDFGLYLFGDAVAHAPVICIALHKMLAQTGLGARSQRVVFRDFTLFLDGRRLYDCGRGFDGAELDGGGGGGANKFDFAAFSGELGVGVELAEFEREFERDFGRDSAAQTPPRTAIVKFLTPLRIKKNNAFVRDASGLDFNDLLGSLYRRHAELLGNGRVRAPLFDGEIIRADARFIELGRNSSRQGEMSLGGLVGEFELGGLGARTYALLRLGEIIGAGKSCVFGLGKMAVEVV